MQNLWVFSALGDLLEPTSLTPLPDPVQQGACSCPPGHSPGPHLQEQRLLKHLAATSCRDMGSWGQGGGRGVAEIS